MITPNIYEVVEGWNVQIGDKVFGFFFESTAREFVAAFQGSPEIAAMVEPFSAEELEAADNQPVTA